MPILWGLVAGVFIYFVLQEMGKQHTLKNKKPSAETPPATEVDADAPSAASESSPETELSPETESSPETVSSPEEKTDRPSFIDTIPGLTQETRQELRQLKLTTCKSIRDASDKKLLAIKGIGPARLKQIRSLCI